MSGLVAVAREMDIALNPYASGLRERCISKRAWDAVYIESFPRANTGDALRFEPTEGVIERTDDTDAFQFTTTGGAVIKEVAPDKLICGSNGIAALTFAAVPIEASAK